MTFQGIALLEEGANSPNGTWLCKINFSAKTSTSMDHNNDACQELNYLSNFSSWQAFVQLHL